MDANTLLIINIVLTIINIFFSMMVLALILDIKDENGRTYKR